jgi:hypothetical protein
MPRPYFAGEPLDVTWNNCAEPAPVSTEQPACSRGYFLYRLLAGKKGSGNCAGKRRVWHVQKK